MCGEGWRRWEKEEKEVNNYIPCSDGEGRVGEGEIEGRRRRRRRREKVEE